MDCKKTFQRQKYLYVHNICILESSLTQNYLTVNLKFLALFVF